MPDCEGSGVSGSWSCATREGDLSARRTFCPHVTHSDRFLDSLQPPRFDSVESAFAIDPIFALEVGRTAFVCKFDTSSSAVEEESCHEKEEEQEHSRDDDERDEYRQGLHARSTNGSREIDTSRPGRR